MNAPLRHFLEAFKSPTQSAVTLLLPSCDRPQRVLDMLDAGPIGPRGSRRAWHRQRSGRRLPRRGAAVFIGRTATQTIRIAIEPDAPLHDSHAAPSAS